jgi:type IV secretory pathway VirB2 component (pilin)
MNFLKKPFFVFYFSIFFLISVEGWAAEIDISSCNPANGVASGICSTTCGAATTLYNFNAGGVKYGSYNTVGASDANCKTACLTACVNYKAAGAGEYSIASTSSNTFSKSICNALRIVTGGAGKTFAAFAIIATGIGFFSGKVSWGLMIGVAAGIATMFGAPSIVAAISGTTVDTKCGLAAG